MKTAKIVFPLALALMFMGTSSCSLFNKTGSDNGVVLRYNLSPGKDVKISSDVVSKIETEQMGQTASVDMNTSNTLGFRTLSAEDGVMDIELDFIKMAQSMKSSTISGDTDYSGLIGKKAKFKLDGMGITSDLRGFDELPDITNVSGETITGDMLKGIVTQVFFKLPDHPVKVGDTWTNEDNSDMPFGGGNLNTESTTVYVVLEKLMVDGRECLKLDVSGKAKTSGEFQQGGMDLVMDRNSTSTGYVIFAIDEGMFSSIQMESKTNSIIDVPVASVQILQEITSSSSIKVSFD